jgi:HNH endonuclease/NUMOD4 motif
MYAATCFRVRWNGPRNRVRGNVGLNTTTFREAVMPAKHYTRENWKPVPVRGFEPAYQVSDKTQVRRSAPGKATYVGRILKPHPNTKGYLTVTLYFAGKRKSCMVHKLVAVAFLGPCPVGKEVNHLNGIKTDCRPSNLRYDTPGDNHRHAYQLWLKTPNATSKLTKDDVKVIRSLAGKRTKVSIARQFHIHPWSVTRIILGMRWKYLR